MNDLKATVENIRLFYHAIDEEIAAGTKHYRDSDGRLLKTAKEVHAALLDEGIVKIKPQEAS